MIFCRRHRLARLGAFLTLGLLALTAQGAPGRGEASSALPPPVAAALQAAHLPVEHLAFSVQPLQGQPGSWSTQAEKSMSPASTIKLVTTFAALDLLGPAYTWRTQALAQGNLRDGRLAGDLVIKGAGDPRFTIEQLGLLLRALRVRGVRQIGGDVILDRSLFSLPPYDPAAFDGEPLRAYNVGPDALLLGFGALRVTLNADGPGRRVDAWLETPLSSPERPYTLRNRIQWSDGECGDWREKLTVSASPDGLELGGSLAVACGEKALYVAALAPNPWTERIFRSLWAELGGTLEGTVRAGTTPADARPLAAMDSPPLADVVRDINKFSNNVMARQLFLSLGLAPVSPGGAAPVLSLPTSRQRVQAWLAAQGIRDVQLDNGSGLSRQERISPASMVRLLSQAWSSPVMPEYLTSLPIAGVDGTLRKRLHGTPAQGRARLKTGSIEGVRGIAGFVPDREGRWWALAAFVNSPRAGESQPVLDALVEWVSRQGSNVRNDRNERSETTPLPAGEAESR